MPVYKDPDGREWTTDHAGPVSPDQIFTSPEHHLWAADSTFASMSEVRDRDNSDPSHPRVPGYPPGFVPAGVSAMPGGYSGVGGVIAPGVTVTTSKPHDPVERPAHYLAGGIECIDAIEAACTPAEFIGFLKGQVIKYNWRLGLKGSRSEDAGKARWYAARLEAFLKKTDALL